MNKFIIKNCNNCNKDKWLDSDKQVTEGYLCSASPYDFECKDITDCLLKRILSYCSDYEESCKMNCIDDRMCSTCFFGSSIELIDEIKDLLEIEEII